MQPCWDQVAGNIWNIVPLFILGKFRQEIGPPCCTIDLSSHNWLLLAIAGDNQVETSMRSREQFYFLWEFSSLLH